MTEASNIHVLLIDDDEDEFVIVSDLFSEIGSGFSLEWVDNYDDARQDLLEKGHDIYLIDYRLGPRNGLDLIREMKERDIIIPMILLTGQGDRKIDMEAMNLGASDYLVKTEVTSNALARSIRYALTNSRNLLEVRAKERKYRSLFERSIDPIYIVDRSFFITDFNESFVQLLGYDKEELIGQNLERIFDDPEAFTTYKQLLTRNGHVKDIEVALKNRDDSVMDCTINGVALEDNTGCTYGFQGIIHDLSLRKQAEHDLLVAEKLAMTGNIARSIAHEVRNPLTNLNLALEQLGDDLEEEASGEYDMYVDIIQRNANRIDQLITEMLESSKPKQLDLKKYSLNTLVDSVINMTRDRLKLRGVSLKQELDPDLPNLNLDPDQMKTAVLNIVINAIESMQEEEGQLIIGTHRDGKQVVLYIEDNGKGIARDQLTKLFDPFFTGKSGGMGLGLTSSQNIINSHKGKVDVQSELGKGTRFDITFPLNR